MRGMLSLVRCGCVARLAVRHDQRLAAATYSANERTQRLHTRRDAHVILTELMEGFLHWLDGDARPAALRCVWPNWITATRALWRVGSAIRANLQKCHVGDRQRRLQIILPADIHCNLAGRDRERRAARIVCRGRCKCYRRWAEFADCHDLQMIATAEYKGGLVKSSSAHASVREESSTTV